MRGQPSFCLVSAETVPVLSPRACFVAEHLFVEGRDDYLLVRIEPPIGGHTVGREYPTYAMWPLPAGMQAQRFIQSVNGRWSCLCAGS
jgi:hypothetical protein